jgi:hypothetical protein
VNRCTYWHATVSSLTNRASTSLPLSLRAFMRLLAARKQEERQRPNPAHPELRRGTTGEPRHVYPFFEGALQGDTISHVSQAAHITKSNVACRLKSARIVHTPAAVARGTCASSADGATEISAEGLATLPVPFVLSPVEGRKRQPSHFARQLLYRLGRQNQTFSLPAFQGEAISHVSHEPRTTEPSRCRLDPYGPAHAPVSLRAFRGEAISCASQKPHPTTSNRCNQNPLRSAHTPHRRCEPSEARQSHNHCPLSTDHSTSHLLA